MTKTLRTLLILLFCSSLLLPLAALAADNNRVYVIQKGDTLWGLSERFIKDPYYWPNLWAHNPFIGNPHLIYPGQKVRIRDGRLEIVPEYEQQVATTPDAGKDQATLPPLPIVQEELAVRVTAGGEGFIAPDGFPYDGRIVDFDGDRLLASENDTVFAQFRNPSSVYAGDDFYIYRIGRKITHPETGRVVGRLIEELGRLQVVRVDGDVATAKVQRTQAEIHRGDVLRVALNDKRIVPLKGSNLPVEGVILGARQDRLGLGQLDYVYIDRGETDGLQVGNVLNVTRPREASKYALTKRGVQLPEQLLGAAVVVDTTASTAVALIVKSVAEIERGDKVSIMLP